jgi:hypothetical protein
MPNTPLTLTDAELDAVLAAAQPILPAQRHLFLQAMAEEIARHEVVGEGLIHRLASDLQRRFTVEARSTAGTRQGEPSPRARQPRQGVRQAGADGSAGPETPPG